MILITRNKQIIGADEEFLEDKSFGEFKQNFSTQLLNDFFSKPEEFQTKYNGDEYDVFKEPIIMDDSIVMLFIFKRTSNDIQATTQSASIQNTIKEENAFGLNDTLESSIDENETKQNDELNIDLISLDEPQEEQTQTPEEEENTLKLDDTLELSADEEIFDKIDESEHKEDEEFRLATNDESDGDEFINDELKLSIDENETKQNDELSIDLISLDEPQEEQTQTLEEEENTLKLDDTLELSADEEIFDKIDESVNKENEELEVTIDEDEIIDLGLDFEEEKDTSQEEFIQFLSLPKKEVEKFIKNELKNASNELSIDIETIEELFEDFKVQIKEEKMAFYDALNNNDYKTLDQIAHKLKGVAYNLRLFKVGKVFETIDELAKKEASKENIKPFIDKIYLFLDKINSEIDNIFTEQNEQNIVTSAVVGFLNEIKKGDLQTIKKHIQSMEKFVEPQKLEKIKNADTQEKAKHYIDELKAELQKEKR